MALVRTDVLEERNTAIFRVERIRKLGIALAVTGDCRALRRNAHYMRTEAIEWNVSHDGREREHIPFSCVFSHTVNISSQRSTVDSYW
jgi:hypothetical protein